MSGTSELENATERKACAVATGLGMLNLKLNVRGNIGWPDRMFLYKHAVRFVEFKREGEKLRPIQEYIHYLMLKQKIRVYVIDNLPDAVALLNKIKEEQDALYPS